MPPTTAMATTCSRETTHKKYKIRIHIQNTNTKKYKQYYKYKIPVNCNSKKMQYGGRATEDVARGPEVAEKWSHYPFLCYLGTYLIIICEAIIVKLIKKGLLKKKDNNMTHSFVTWMQ